MAKKEAQITALRSKGLMNFENAATSPGPETTPLDGRPKQPMGPPPADMYVNPTSRDPGMNYCNIRWYRQGTNDEGPEGRNSFDTAQHQQIQHSWACVRPPPNPNWSSVLDSNGRSISREYEKTEGHRD
ncbi:unnamed protein product [Colletotrichum noveboracense]|uniref:Uncharacterized protein n=1 Tax=Colletotrichum noveboracense TaxID=2664923 RepID=A0A9W4W6G1_9PEZI|nr:unnamed protein product [Colletotrichum noveboracense]